MGVALVTTTVCLSYGIFPMKFWKDQHKVEKGFASLYILVGWLQVEA